MYSNESQAGHRPKAQFATMLFSAAITFSMLLPLMLIFMQGPSVSAELAAGFAISVGGLFLTRQMRELKRAVPYVVCMVPYMALAFYWKDLDNDLTAKYTLGLILYLVPAGLLMREMTDRGQGRGVLLGIIISSLCLAAVGLEVLHTVGIENLVKSMGISLSRNNVENETYKYLHFFVITNVIIGMSTFGVCALTCVVVLILDVPFYAKVLSLVGFGIALYINVQVITRGAIVSAALGMVLSLPWVASVMGPRKVFRYSLLAAMGVAGVLAYGYFYNRAIWEKLSVLTERISESGDDSRLTHWNEAVGIIQRDIWGGGRGFMQTHTWAHNFFLDTALTAGIPGFLSLLALLLVAFFHIGRVLLRGRRTLDPVFLVLLAMFLAVLVLTMTSPPSLPLFGVLLLAAGFFARPFNRDQTFGY
jgi:hypothetical protein